MSKLNMIQIYITLLTEKILESYFDASSLTCKKLVLQSWEFNLLHGSSKWFAGAIWNARFAIRVIFVTIHNAHIANASCFRGVIRVVDKIYGNIACRVINIRYRNCIMSCAVHRPNILELTEQGVAIHGLGQLS